MSNTINMRNMRNGRNERDRERGSDKESEIYTYIYREIEKGRK